MAHVRDKSTIPQPLWVTVPAILLSVLVFAPLHGLTQEIEPDLSFRVVTHDAFVRSLQWGVDIVSTYGPWGFLFRGFDSRTDVLIFLVNSSLGVIFGVSLVVHLQRVPGVLLRLAILAGVLSLLSAGGSDARYFGFLLLAMLSRSDREESSFSTVSALLMVGTGVIALIKFSYFLLAGVLCLLLTAMDAFERRRLSKEALLLAASTVTFWLAAGQNPANLFSWVSWSLEMAAGYSRGGVVEPRPGELTHVLYVGASLALVLLSSILNRNRAMSHQLFRAAGLTIGLWFIFKASFVRFDDSHSVTAASCLGFLALLVLPVDARDLRPRIRGMLSVAFVAASFGGAWVGVDSLRARGSFVARMVGDPSFLSRADAVNRAAVRARYPVPRVDGTIDSLHAGQAALIAADLRYIPRPVFQSYLAWSGELAQLNAKHFAGRASPDYLRIEFLPVDGHHPLLEDGAAWLEILRRYRPSSRFPPLLERRDSARKVARRLRYHAMVMHGDAIPLPVGKLVWAEIRARPGISARILRTIARGPVQTMELSYRNHPSITYRLTPAAEAGFLLTPINGESRFAEWLLDAGELTEMERPQTLTLHSGEVGERFLVRIWELEFQ